jgi:hypothetical protein
MFITIGILAYNEGASIAGTLESLFRQSALQDRRAGEHWQIVVVPNGCTDDTDAVARAALTALTASAPSGEVSFVVESLRVAGKSNAWNEFIHRIADPRTEVFVLMDADIEMGLVGTVRNCVDCLLENPHARAVCDLPLKDFIRKARLTLIEKLSARASRVDLSSPVGLAGSFYCAKAETLRSVWMPIGLSVEDGFLAAMIATDCFRSEPDYTRIIRASEATHYFEGLTRLSDIIEHEVRLVIGSMLNAYLCWNVLLFTTPPDGEGAGISIRDLNVSRPDWYERMMSNQIAIGGRWLFSLDVIFRRFARLGGMSLLERIRHMPWAVAATFFDVVVFWKANHKLRSGRAIGYW